MRVLVVRPGPHFSVQDVHRGWLRGLSKNGCQVVDFNLDDRLTLYEGAYLEGVDGEWRKALSRADAVKLAAKGVETACYEFWPDLVVVVSGFFVPPAMYELMRARGHKVVLLCTESPYEDGRQQQLAALVDAVVLNDPSNIDEFRQINPNTVFMGHCYDPDVHVRRAHDLEAASDFCFVGTGYPSRLAFLEQVDWSGIDVKLAGNWETAADSPLREHVIHPLNECLPNDQAVDLYSSTKASANLYRRESEPGRSDGWAMTPREVELAALGTFFLRDSRGEGDVLLPMLPTFDGPGDFGEKLRWWLAHDHLREEAAAKAQVAVADRTFEHNAARLLRLVETL